MLVTAEFGGKPRSRGVCSPITVFPKPSFGLTSLRPRDALPQSRLEARYESHGKITGFRENSSLSRRATDSDIDNPDCTGFEVGAADFSSACVREVHFDDVTPVGSSTLMADRQLDGQVYEKGASVGGDVCRGG